MNDSTLPADGPGNASPEETWSALFAQMVIQQANTALMLLGKMPEPQSGQTLQDLEAAKLFIDQLEMLEVKTKGNLLPPEERLLKQSLASVRMAFVEVVEAAPSSGSCASAEAPAAGEAAPSAAQAGGATAPAEEESRKKFTKKY
jgi:hypothetical protein